MNILIIRIGLVILCNNKGREYRSDLCNNKKGK